MLRRLRKKIGKQKASLDTSTQIQKFKSGEDFLQKIKEDYNLYAQYFTLYEYKTGLINSWINFYYTVEIEGNPSDAYAKWSNRGYKPRDLSNVLILTSFILRKKSSINNDLETHLRKIEAAIYTALQIFEVGVEAFIGNFATNEVVRYEIHSSDDYKAFTEYINKHKFIPLGDFWNKHTGELKILTSKKKSNSQRDIKIFDTLNEVLDETETANRHAISKQLGDAVLCAELVQKHTLVSNDKMQEFFCELLEKNYLNFSSI